MNNRHFIEDIFTLVITFYRIFSPTVKVKIKRLQSKVILQVQYFSFKDRNICEIITKNTAELENHRP